MSERLGFDSFQSGALRTWNQCDTERQVNAALGLAGECGECVELIKKHRFHGKPYHPDALAAELGDVLFYLAVCAHEAGLSLADIAEANHAKLAARYPDGFRPGGGVR
jgi:NTP pyrophosphatase (non-canonical NTP hydrolase)